MRGQHDCQLWIQGFRCLITLLWRLKYKIVAQTCGHVCKVWIQCYRFLGYTLVLPLIGNYVTCSWGWLLPRVDSRFQISSICSRTFPNEFVLGRPVSIIVKSGFKVLDQLFMLLDVSKWICFVQAGEHGCQVWVQGFRSVGKALKNLKN